MVLTAMGKNTYLSAACKRVGVHKFILHTPLARGEFVPINLTLSMNDGETVKKAYDPECSMGLKVAADVVESLLGLIYLHFDYEKCCEISLELGLSLPFADHDKCAIGSDNQHVVPDSTLLERVKELTGMENFSSPCLVAQAFTHPTTIYEDVQSYELLEWVGDAVLCLASRDWMFHQHPDMSVGDLVILDSAFVSNEILAHQCVKVGLHRFINHRDQKLVSQFEQYESTINEMGRGIWGTDPSKILSDVVEAVFGAVHIDAGFQPGQTAVLTLMGPVLEGIKGLRGDVKNVQHPVSVMYEKFAALLKSGVQREDKFLRVVGETQKEVWQGSRWRSAQVGGVESIGLVNFLGKHVLSVADSSNKSARSRACALFVAAMEQNPELAQRLTACLDLIKA